MLAMDNSIKGKRNYNEVKRIMKKPLPYVYRLHESLVDGSYQTSPYHIFKKESGNKVREIYKLPFYPDRVLHHAIVQVLFPTWMSLLIDQTYSTIPGRGVHSAASRMKKDLLKKDQTKYCLKIDVKKYYQSIDHEILLNILSRKINDEKMMDLLEKIISSANGIPIGNYISQWFGNIYLAYFDHWVKEDLRCKYYYRYCDDIVILAPDKETLWHWFVKIKDYLNNKLALEIKENYQVFPVEKRGVDFLGYRFFHGYTLARKRIVQAMKRKQDKPESMSSYYGWFVHADCHRLIQKYFKDNVYARA